MQISTARSLGLSGCVDSVCSYRTMQALGGGGYLYSMSICLAPTADVQTELAIARGHNAKLSYTHMTWAKGISAGCSGKMYTWDVLDFEQLHTRRVTLLCE